jgi:hypothetical protein
MSERDVLLNWLTRAALRLRLVRRLRELGWTASVLLGLLALYLLLRATPVPAAVLAALVPLLLLAALAVVLVYCWRVTRRPSLAHAAGRADAQGSLDDELKSAYWFVQHDDMSAPVASMLRHAARTVQRLDPRELFPLSVPASALPAVALAAVAVALATLPTGSPGPQFAEAGVANVPNPTNAARRSAWNEVGARDERFGFGALRQDARSGKPQDDQAIWSRAEEAGRSLANGEEREALQRAVQDRDTKRVMQLLDATRPGLPLGGGPAARPEANQVSPEVAQGILDRLRELLSEDGEPAAEDSKPMAGDGDIRLTQERSSDPQEPQQRDKAHRDEAEDVLNAALRSLSRNGIERRQAVGGQGEAQGWQEGGATNLNGGAMGRRVGVSRAGAGDGNSPPGNPSGNAESEPVLGKQTLRLAAQLQRLNAGGNVAGEQEGTPEAFYAATQAQASRQELLSVSGAARAADEAALERRQLPLAYRSAVKKYFLTEHEKEH